MTTHEQSQHDTPNSKDADFVGSDKPSEPDWKSRLRSILQAAWQETGHVVTVTVRHIRRWTTSVWIEGQRQFCVWRLNRQKIIVGERMHAAGLGDDNLRERISWLDHSIQQAKAKKQSVRQDVRSRRSLLRQLGDSLPETTEGAIAVEAEKLHLFRQRLTDLKETRQQQKQAPSPTLGEWMRIGVGYGAIMLFVVLGVSWSLNGSPKGQVDQSKTDALGAELEAVPHAVNPATSASDLQSKHHASSRKVLREASAATTEWKADPNQDRVEQFRELQQRRYLLIDIALAQGKIADVAGVEQNLSRHQSLKNTLRELEGLSPSPRLTLDDVDVDIYVALGVAHAMSGNPKAADAALARLTDKNVVIVGSLDEAKAKVVAKAAIAHTARNDERAAYLTLDRLKSIANKTEELSTKAKLLGQLAEAQANIGLVADARKTVESLVALETAGNDTRTAVNEALASVVRAQAASGDVEGSKQTLSRLNRNSIFADNARFELATLLAQGLAFRNALETANDIANDFLKARAIIKILDAELTCGPIFQESAGNLSNLLKEVVESHKSNPTLHKQLRTDTAVAEVKWQGVTAVLPDSFSGPPSAVAAMQQLQQTSITAHATSALLELEADDLMPEQKARIALAVALTSAEQKKTEKADHGFLQAIGFADHASELAEKREVLNSIGRGFVHTGQIAMGRDAVAASKDSLSRAALLLGIGEGLYSQELVERATKEGIRYVGHYGGLQKTEAAGHALWRTFVGSLPGDLQTESQQKFLVLSGEMQLLATPTQSGIAFTFPPSFAGLKGWTVIVAKSMFDQRESEVLTGIVEQPFGFEERAGRFLASKRLVQRPKDWLSISISQLKKGGVSQNAGETRSVDELIELLKSDNEKTREEAEAALVAEGKTAVESLIATFPKDRELAIRAAAVLGKIGKPSVKPLLAALDDPGNKSDAFIFEALSKVGEDAEAAVPNLISMMKQHSGESRAMGASFVLGRIGKPAVPSLVRILRTETGVTLIDAMNALEEIGPDAKPAVKDLVFILENEGFLLQIYAANTLGAIGSNAKEALPHLKRHLNNRNDKVRRASAEAIEAITAGINQSR